MGSKTPQKLLGLLLGAVMTLPSVAAQYYSDWNIWGPLGRVFILINAGAIYYPGNPAAHAFDAFMLWVLLYSGVVIPLKSKDKAKPFLRFATVFVTAIALVTPMYMWRSGMLLFAIPLLGIMWYFVACGLAVAWLKAILPDDAGGWYRIGAYGTAWFVISFVTAGLVGLIPAGAGLW